MMMQYANLALRFILELCALYAMGLWGFQVGSGGFARFVFGVGTPLMAAVAWGLFASPAAPLPLPLVMRVLLEIAIFGLAVASVYAVGHPVLAMFFGVIVLVNRMLMVVWEQ